MKTTKRHLALWGIVLMGLVGACTSPEGPKRFTLLTAEETGVTFSNKLEESLSFNIFNYLYFYNGGGVSAGDVNGDGLVDLYFTANQHHNALYLNQGDFKFKEVTETAGVAGMGGWTTGVTMADVNADGKLDIYVSQLGDYQHISGRNQLYINQGNNAEGVPTFKNEARAFGLELRGFSTQAAFFDYDRDGDLDLYQLMHSVHSNGTFGSSDMRYEKHNLAGDRLLRNDDGVFTDVTDSSGIYSSALGYGLGIAIGDVNRDGWPDIYIGNDFHEDDYLYINNGDGTFTDQLQEQLRHTSRFSMGNDLADFNNDGWLDILSLDMLPNDYEKLKASTAEDPYNVYHQKLRQGYFYQYARNKLQLNQGNGHFSDIGLMTETFATDWSWSGLMTDLDLDGRKDIYIANGIKRRTTDQDYISYVSSEAVKNRLKGDLTEKELELIGLMPEVKIPNAVYQNEGSLSFKDVSEAWGLNQESYSNGAAYADLDNDGDLDLVVNNLSDSAFIFRNETISPSQETTPNYLKIAFEGPDNNPLGIGAEVRVETATGTQLYTHYLTRGFLSSVAPGLLFGLGEEQSIEQLTVTWPTGEQQILKDPGVNGTLTLSFEQANGPEFVPALATQTLFQNVPDALGVNYTHQENYLVEFNREFLMPHMVSTEGPAVTVGDVDGDGDEDFVVGGGKWQAARLYLQTENGFVESDQADLIADSISENVALELADVDGDGDLDLISLPGGNEWNTGHPNTRPRLYRNDGAGSFSLDATAFPESVALQGGALAIADYDGDGHLDVFLGARSLPYHYGAVPSSFLLKNNGTGQFEDVTQELLPGSGQVGMVCDAHWADMNSDGRQDLVLAAEWEWPVILLQNEQGVFGEVHARTYGFDQEGLWNTLVPYDIDNDGDLDLLGGNLGLNSKLKASAEEPIRLYAEDLDNNGSVDHLLTYYEEGEESLFATKMEITQQLLAVQKRFPQYTEYAKASFEDIIPANDLRGVFTRRVNELRSGAFINKGEGRFTFEPFERAAQVAPIGVFLPLEIENERYVLAGGNFHATNIQFGRYDASYGVALEVHQDGSLQAVASREAGLEWVGEVRDLAAIQVGTRTIILVVRNNDTLLMVEPTPKVEMDFPIANQE
ncbi:MAG TPA: hypothetical protein DCR93_30920 [Cytophagales bacterium]|nr:hypothetical protein [Cytophagales bacterium]